MSRLKALGIVLIFVLASMTAACTPSGAGPAWTFTPAAAGGSPAPGSTGSPAPSTGEPDGGDGVMGTIELDAIDIAYEQPHVTVPKAGTYEVKLVNKGAIGHDVTFADGTQVVAAAGETKTVEVTVPAAGISFKCSVPGHADAGMIGDIMIEGATASANPDDHGGPAPSSDVAADPNAAPYTLYPAEAPALLPGTTHDIDLVIEEKKMTVAPGFVQAVWTFGGTVPGPVIRVKVGDTVRIHLKNPATSQLSHSIDFHASQVAWNDEMLSIAPGEEKLYEFKAEYAGVWMYHCGTSPTLHHIANGMYGMVIVEPKAGLPPVDAEFAIVQSEWYLGPQGEPASLTKASTGNPAPDYVVFNGVANQYKDHPLQVQTGDRVRVFVLNAGPNIDSSFHVVGTIFSSVTKEGIHLVVGNDGNWASQAMDLAPAQAGIVEFVMPEDGLYPMVTHAFNFVGRGALGLFQAGDGDPLN
ncbi:MAG: multicopper oxidase domain-containing protein [Chloroflexota bacterium]